MGFRIVSWLRGPNKDTRTRIDWVASLVWRGYLNAWLQFAMREHGESPMAIYQCFFFSGGRIRNWENVECETVSSLRSLLARRLANGAWDAAEGWMQDDMVYRVERRLAEYNGSRIPTNVPVFVAE